MSRPTSHRTRRPLSLALAASTLVVSSLAALAACGRAPTEASAPASRATAPGPVSYNATPRDTTGRSGGGTTNPNI